MPTSTKQAVKAKDRNLPTCKIFANAFNVMKKNLKKWIKNSIEQVLGKASSCHKN